jgi:hypothetical protein
MSGEDQAPLGDVARRADEDVALAPAQTRSVVGDHARKNQLAITRTATHRSHSDQQPSSGRLPMLHVQKKEA